MSNFIEIRDNSLEEIIQNAMILFRHNDLGGKIETSLNSEIKKENKTAPDDAPMQLRLRLQNRFNMDLNNVYALEIFPTPDGRVIETSVNVYHDDFNLEEFTATILNVFNETLKNVDLTHVLRRFEYNYRNTFLHWKSAKEKQFIIDPHVKDLQEMHDAFVHFLTLAKDQLQPFDSCRIHDLLTFKPDILLEKRKQSYAKSKILKIQHTLPADVFDRLMAGPQVFSTLLLEYLLVPLFLANELYVMCLIYKRNLADIRTVLRRRLQEI